MPKQTNHQSRTEQINNRVSKTAIFHDDPYRPSRPNEAKYEQTKETVDDNAIQLLAYQIYQKKGGSALDNWLEAEKTLRKGNNGKKGYSYKVY